MSVCLLYTLSHRARPLSHPCATNPFETIDKPHSLCTLVQTESSLLSSSANFSAIAMSGAIYPSSVLSQAPRTTRLTGCPESCSGKTEASHTLKPATPYTLISASRHPISSFAPSLTVPTCSYSVPARNERGRKTNGMIERLGVSTNPLSQFFVGELVDVREDGPPDGVVGLFEHAC